MNNTCYALTLPYMKQFFLGFSVAHLYQNENIPMQVEILSRLILIAYV